MEQPVGRTRGCDHSCLRFSQGAYAPGWRHPARTLTVQYNLAMKIGSNCGMACLLALLCCLGCHTSASHSTIAVIPRDSAEEIWVSEHGGAVDAAFRHRLHIYWNGPTRNDEVEQQIALCEKAIAGHYYGLILSPNNSFALDTTIHRAVAHGIPVVIVGAQIPIAPQRGLTFVLNDAGKTGALAAERAHEILGEKGQVILLGVDALSPGSVERSSAFEQALQREAPRITVQEKVAETLSFGQAEQASEQAIHSFPGRIVIFALGPNATEGAAAAVRNTGTSNRIRIIGCDQTLDLLFLLRHGQIDSLIVENTRAMGNLAVKEIIAEKHGQRVPLKTLVEPVLVTRENVDQDTVQQILSLRWRPRQ